MQSLLGFFLCPKESLTQPRTIERIEVSVVEEDVKVFDFSPTAVHILDGARSISSSSSVKRQISGPFVSSLSQFTR